MAGRPPAPRQPPFYPTVTPTKVEYPGTAASAGTTESIDLPLVTLPPGTILFRGVRMSTRTPQDKLKFYRDFLGDPMEDGTVCLDPTHNTFFYPYPYPTLGAHDVGKTYNAIAVYVLVHPTNVIANMSPSEWVRGFGNRYHGNAPYQRCTEFLPLKCPKPEYSTYLGSKALAYDNCINPDYAVSSGVRGWMALADLDSFEPKKLLKIGGTSKEAPMSQAMLDLAMPGINLPDQLNMMLAFAYRDAHNHAGFPEIALYPQKKHPGRAQIIKPCPNERVAGRLLEREAGANNLNYLPLALLTKSRITDMTNGKFETARLKLTDTNLYSYASNELVKNADEWLARGFYEGYKLPFYGEGKVCVDSRTGFFVLPQMIPRNMSIPIPPPIRAAEGKETPERIPYKGLMLAMDNPEAQKRAIHYALLFRNFLPSTFMKKYEPKLTGLRRAFIFGRPAMLKEVAEKLEVSLPPEFLGLLRQAAGLYQKESGVKPKAKPAAGAAAGSAAAAGGPARGFFGSSEGPALSPIRIPGSTPPFAGNAGIAPVGAEEAGGTPLYGNYTPKTPEFGGEPTMGGQAAAAGAPAYAPRTPEFGGGAPRGGRRPRRTRGRGSKRMPRRKTRRTASHATQDIQLGHTFAKVWSAHAKANA